MYQRPSLLSTSRTDEQFGGVTYHLEGELVPVLTVELSNMPIYFEHHILLWKHPTVQIGIKPMKGAIKRMIAGIQIFVTEARGTGSIAFSRDGAGHVVPLHLRAGDGIHVREHQFLAATESIDYTYERVQGFANMLFGGTGFFIDKFVAQQEGILWLHGYGNVFEKTLEAGEIIDVEPGGWLYKEPSVQMETQVQKLSTGLLAGMNIVFNRFTGPGRIALQSMYLHSSDGADDRNQSNAASNVVGGLSQLGKLFGG
jgi:uncharacterized protein (AIM24 family)